MRHASDTGDIAHEIPKTMTVQGAPTSADSMGGVPVQRPIDAESQEHRKAAASMDGADAIGNFGTLP